MKKYTEHCDFCEKEFDNDKNGFCVKIGYSKGGWGNRSDFVKNTSGEICDGCFLRVSKLSIEMNELIHELNQKPKGMSIKDAMLEHQKKPFFWITEHPKEVYLVMDEGMICGCFDSKGKAENYFKDCNPKGLTIKKLEVT